jgi:hypothetical protein
MSKMKHTIKPFDNMSVMVKEGPQCKNLTLLGFNYTKIDSVWNKENFGSVMIWDSEEEIAAPIEVEGNEELIFNYKSVDYKINDFKWTYDAKNLTDNIKQIIKENKLNELPEETPKPIIVVSVDIFEALVEFEAVEEGKTIKNVVVEGIEVFPHPELQRDMKVIDKPEGL